MSPPPRIHSFQEFWPHYVLEHQSPGCRALHFIGTTLGVLAAVLALVMWNAWWLLAAPLLGYGISWLGHFLIERNRPVAFRYPVWSFRADARMWRLMALGRMRRELETIQGA